MEQIELLMWSKPETLEKPFYFLTERLDCKSAIRYIQKGEYVKHRVFFADELTAIEAGYRPCGVCMKERYKQWKKNPSEFK